MRKKNKPLPIIENVTIADVAAEGKAIARIDDYVVFVPWVAPGDVVDLRLHRKKKNFAEGEVIRFHQYADERVAPFCEHFTVCGGCKWQHLPYEAQLRYKQRQVVDSLVRIGKVDVGEICPIIGSEQTVEYRNKLEYTFSNRRWLTDGEFTEHDAAALSGAGFHIPGKFDKVLDINRCHLQDDISNRIRRFVKDFCLSHGYPFFDLRENTGFIRTLVVRTSSMGETMIIVVFYDNDVDKRNALLAAVDENFPEITSLMYVINGKCNDTINDLEVALFAGRDHIMEKMEGLRFKINPKSFYQTNSRQAYKLYSVVREFAALTGNENVYDLYTGVGTIANFVARNARQVIGIEYVPEAIDDAKANSALNNLHNTLFFAGDMRRVLNSDFVAEHGRPDVVITDPPRSGMHDDVTDAIIAAAPQRIVYVSCNPATQARDINRMSAAYRVCKIQPVDMFPHTHHVENVALLEYCGKDL